LPAALAAVLALFACPLATRGQAAASTAAIPASEPTALSAAAPASPAAEAPAIGGASAAESDAFTAPQRDAVLGLTDWDHTLLGAFQLGARLAHLPSLAALPAPEASVLHAPAVMTRFSSSGATHVSLDTIARALRMDQLERQGMNLNMKSAYGNFRFQYREIFANGKTNALGGGVGQASAAATYTTPRFGTGGLMDFSAAALMGTGSINQLMGSGFGNSNIGGNGPGHKSQTAPTVAIKLTF
jgi:hypothetical protein